MMTTEINKIKTDDYNQSERVIVPPADIYETEGEYVIKADIPGVSKENIDITLDNDTLSINGKISRQEDYGVLKYSEYALYNFSRSFNVGKDID
jgi:HSP20 family protein